MTTRVIWLALLLPALGLAGCSRSAPPAAAPPAMAFKAGTKPPGAVVLWPAPADPAASLLAAGLEPLAREGTVYHLHAHLEVFKDGKQVVVPANIGVGPQASFYSPLHTHTPDGILHVESEEVRDYTLGQFFAMWGVSLVGAKALENGEAVAEPARLVIDDFDLITVVFGEEP